MNFEPLNTRYSFQQRLSLLINHKVLKVAMYVITIAIVFSFLSYAWRIFTDDLSGGSAEVAGRILTSIILLVPFALLGLVLINIVTDRAVKSERFRRFAYANNWNYQQYVEGLIDHANPYWDSVNSVAHLDTINGEINGHEFWLSVIMHRTPDAPARRPGIRHTVVCFVGGARASDVSGIVSLYDKTESQETNSGVYILFPDGISFKPKDLQEFFEALQNALTDKL